MMRARYNATRGGMPRRALRLALRQPFDFVFGSSSAAPHSDHERS
jgi:hypothetical protein